MDFIAQPDDEFRLGDFLTQSLANKAWTDFRAAVAFAKRSGTKHVRDALSDFSKRATVRISIGIDSGGTSAEGLEDLIAAVAVTGKLWIFHNANSSTFHPKIYLFKNETVADLVIGSGNLTEGGLYTNYEANIRLRLDLARREHRALLASVEAALNRWSTPRQGVCFVLNQALLKQLVSSGEVPTEAEAREAEEALLTSKPGGSKRGDSIFKALSVRAAPKVSRRSTGAAPSAGLATALAKPAKTKPGVSAPPISAATGARGTLVTAIATRTFLMTLQNTDVGYGQVTSGTSRRSPEIFIPIGAVDADEDFWGWPGLFVVDKAWSRNHAAWIAKKKAKARRSTRPLEKMDRNNVHIRIVKTGTIVSATMWYNPDKTDLRIRHAQLRAGGNVGDILVFKAAPTGVAYDYDFEVVPPTDAQFAALYSACNVNVTGNSRKRFGYI